MSKPIKKITKDTPIEDAEIIELGQTQVYNEYPYFYMPTHPLAAKGGMVSASRHNASIKVGRWLSDGKLVYRLDGNPQNIHPDNLRIVRSPIKKVTADTPVEEAEIIELGQTHKDSASGYPRFHMPTHPLATKYGVVSASRHNASIKEGHWLTKEEYVRHLDRNPQNFHPDNLEAQKAMTTSVCDYCSKRYRAYAYDIARYKGNYCSHECFALAKRIPLVGPKELKKLAWEKSKRQLAADFGVSVSLIHTRCLEYDITTPPAGYWQKVYHGWTHDEALEDLGYRDVGGKFVELEKIW